MTNIYYIFSRARDKYTSICYYFSINTQYITESYECRLNNIGRDRKLFLALGKEVLIQNFFFCL